MSEAKSDNTNTIISHLKLSSATFSLSLQGIVIHPDLLTNPNLTNLSKIARKSVSKGVKACQIICDDFRPSKFQCLILCHSEAKFQTSVKLRTSRHELFYLFTSEEKNVMDKMRTIKFCNIQHLI